jgi:hypothetical protein
MLYCVNEKEGFESFFKLLDEFLAREKNLESDEVNQMMSNSTTKAALAASKIGSNDESSLQQKDTL